MFLNCKLNEYVDLFKKEISNKAYSCEFRVKNFLKCVPSH